MSTWSCAGCATEYSVGAPCCPHCRANQPQEDSMPKITEHGGPSYAGHVDTSPDDVAVPDWQPPADEPAAVVEPEPAPKPGPRRRVTRARKTTA